jgi:hypothetical protein
LHPTEKENKKWERLRLIRLLPRDFLLPEAEKLRCLTTTTVTTSVSRPQSVREVFARALFLANALHLLTDPLFRSNKAKKFIGG